MNDATLKIKFSPLSDRPDWMILGQSAPPRKVDFRELNEKQRRLVRWMYDLRSVQTVFSLKDLAVIFEKEAGSFRANSWVRNGLRLLAVGGWVVRTARGHYKLTEEGIAGLRRW